MSAAACRLAWVEPGDKVPAKALDDAFPLGACEIHSLSDPRRTAVANEEMVARILVSPGDYDHAVKDLLTDKLKHCYVRGLSIIRQGASDQEIIDTIALLLAAKAAETLVGAVVLPTSKIRAVGAPTKQFCVYDTDAPGTSSHADVVGLFDTAMSKTAWLKEEKRRRYALRDSLRKFVVHATSPAELLIALRRAGV